MVRFAPLFLALSVACTSGDKDPVGFDSDPFGDPDDVDGTDDEQDPDDDDDESDEDTDVSDVLSTDTTDADASDSAGVDSEILASDAQDSAVALSDEKSDVLVDSGAATSDPDVEPSDSGAVVDDSSASNPGSDLPSDRVTDGPDGSDSGGFAVTDSGAVDSDGDPSSDADTGVVVSDPRESDPFDSAMISDPPGPTDSAGGLDSAPVGDSGAFGDTGRVGDTGGEPGLDTGVFIPSDRDTSAGSDWVPPWGDTGGVPADTSTDLVDSGDDPLTDWGWNDTGLSDPPVDTGPTTTDVTSDPWNWGDTAPPSDPVVDTGGATDPAVTDPWGWGDTGVDVIEAGELVITEVMINPDECTDPDGEYVEITNASDRAINVEGLRLIDDASVASLVGRTLAPGERIWIARAPTAVRCFGAPDLEITAQFQLANTTDDVRLETANGRVLDEVVWTNLAFGAASWKLDDRALGWTRPDLANDDAGNWCPSTVAIPGHTDKGSPGEINGQCASIAGPPDTGAPDATDAWDSGGAVSTDLMIVEVVDHATNASVKYVEIYNPAPFAQSLSGWSLSIAANGAASATSTFNFPVADIAAGGTVVVAWSTGAVEFSNTFGRSATFTSSAASGNGDDTYFLTRGGVTVDVYGVLGVDGDGQPWNYMDAVAKRRPGINAPRATWSAAEWTITGGAGSAAPFTRN